VINQLIENQSSSHVNKLLQKLIT